MKLTAFFILSSFCLAQAESVGFWIGNRGNKGIYKVILNTETGELSESSIVAKSIRSTALCLRGDGKVLFSVGKLVGEEGIAIEGGAETNAIHSFEVLPEMKLKLVNQKSTIGTGCFVSLGQKGRTCFVANYWEGSLTSFKVAENGELSEPVSYIKHEGSSIHERQEAAHAHSIYSSPDNKFAYVADFGMDKVLVYGINEKAASLTKISSFSVPPGSGPRHMTFSPSFDKLLVLNELMLSITIFDRNISDGSLKLIETKPITRQTPNGELTSSEIRFSDDGKYIYTAVRDLKNKGRDVICILDAESLNIIDEQPAGVSVPRHFSISPDGQCLIVAGQNTNKVVVFKRDPHSGKLTKTPYYTEIDQPMWILFE